MLGILSAQRCQTLHFLNIRDTVLTDQIVKFWIGDKLKHNKLGKDVHELEFPAYLTYTCLSTIIVKEYIERTKSLRGDITSFFIAYVKPYKAASKYTMSTWIKATLGQAGID